jgi:hypothetical protein
MNGAGIGRRYVAISTAAESLEIYSYSFDPLTTPPHSIFVPVLLNLFANGEYSTFSFPTTRNHFDHHHIIAINTRQHWTQYSQSHWH